MKPGVLLIEPMMPEIEIWLEEKYHVHRYYRAQDKVSFVRPIAADIRAIVTGGRLGASNELMDELPMLEIIAINGVGTDAVDLVYAKRRAINVTITPDVLTNDVADMGIALLLACFRQLCTGDRLIRSKRWVQGETIPLGHSATGKKLGIFGMGKIGRALARRAVGFEMVVAYHDHHCFDDLPYRPVASLLELAALSDALIIAASAGPQTHKVVNETVLEALGREGVLVNVARGSIVDEPALVAALVSGKLGAAGLDVFADEPNVPHALLGLANVVVQPHQASATSEARRAMGRLVLDNLAAQFAGRDVPSAVA